METNMISAAERMSDLAEDNFKSGDIDGALRSALKAQDLFPSLPGLHQMIAAFNVHIAATTRKLPTGDVDWYAILDIDNPFAADADTVKKQLNKMRLLTHPDKNRSAAAISAFRLVEEAGESILKSLALLQKAHTNCPPPSASHRRARRPCQPATQYRRDMCDTCRCLRRLGVRLCKDNMRHLCTCP